MHLSLLEAFKWFGLSAGNGYREAMLRLSEMHETGAGAPRDPERAEYWRGMAEKTEEWL